MSGKDVGFTHLKGCEKMSNITNISASLQASQTYESAAAAVRQTASGAEPALTSIYESLDAGVSVELSGPDGLLDAHKADTDKISAMKEDLNSHIDALKQMVLKLLDTQGNISNVATDNLHKLVNKITAVGGIDQLAKSEAQALISEDGYWGVNQTSQRILDFAKALSGGDPSKIELLKDAFQKGFDQAEALWGGKLLVISYETYDRVMRGFEEWANGTTASEASLASED